MRKFLIYYSFILLTLLTVLGFLEAKEFSQIVSAILFFPLVIYFGQFILPRRKRALPSVSPVAQEEPEETEEEEEEEEEEQAELPETSEEESKEPHEEALEGKIVGEGFDINRRLFLKLIGSAGITLFLFSLFTKKSEAAFFGSVPGTGTISLKDTTGAKIDPAIKQPTDGYTIAQVDDGVSNTYYGYLNKDGAWYILREDSSNNYRYVKGNSNFATNWTNRSSLTYDYFDAVF